MRPGPSAPAAFTICVNAMTLRYCSFLVLLFLIGVAAFSGEHDQPLPVDPDRAAAAHEFVLGRYIGWLPCGDCTAVRADLQLYATGEPAVPTRYSLRRIHVAAAETVLGFEERGRWRILPSPDHGDGMVFRLEPGGGQPALDLRRLDDGRLWLAGPKTGVQADPVLYRIPAARQEGVVDIGAGDVAMPVALEQGQQLRVNLSGSPASGRRWELADAGAGLLRMEQDPGGGAIDTAGTTAGQGGTHSWQFRAVGKGSTRLRFLYRRDWESPQAPAQVAEFSIKVL